MDHKWGRNWYALGLSPLVNGTVVARWPALPQAYLTNDFIAAGLVAYWGVPLPGMESTPYSLFGWNVDPGDHFPYGLTVEPDGPV